MKLDQDHLKTYVMMNITDQEWLLHPMWVTWATELDSTGLWYMLDDDHDLLTSFTNIVVPYIQVKCGNISFKIIGHSPYLNKADACLWNDKYCLTGIVSSDVMIKWAKAVQESMKDEGKNVLWKHAYYDALDYFKLHRKIVRCVGEALDVNMDDHDLSKTTLFQYALGYLFHWRGEHEDGLKTLAWEVVNKRHLEKEDHHPEYKNGAVDPIKLFCDRLSVHLQKDKDNDKCNGWLIADHFIPVHFQREWSAFKRRHTYIDLYKELSRAKTGGMNPLFLDVTCGVIEPKITNRCTLYAVS